MDAHPSLDELAAFDRGMLGPDPWRQVEAHVARCEHCCGVLESLGDDALSSLLRGLGEAEVVTPVAAETGEWPARPTVTEPPEVPEALRDHPRYRVLGLIGRGGMGAVYKAEHRLMERPVALKVIRPELLESPAMVRRFEQEAKAAAKLSHPNVVAAYDADEAGGTHFLVMEFVEGTSLDKYVAQRGPLPVDEAIDYVRQAAQGLQHAWDHGMIHRDVKPHNLLRTPDGRVKVLDFGLAAFHSEHPAHSQNTPAGSVVGTPDYIAPEQALDPRSADVRADLYSLGCTLYHLLTGRPPFPHGSALHKLMAHREQEPPPVTRDRPDVPLWVAVVLARLLEKDPARRYATPAELIDALDARAAPAPSRGRRRKWWPVVAAAAAAVLLALVLVPLGVVAMWLGGRPVPTTTSSANGPPDTGATGASFVYAPIPRPELPEGPHEFKLPEEYAQLCSGGCGRFLLFHLKKERQVWVYDVASLKAVKKIDLDTDDVLLAAGATKFFLVKPAQKLLERWSFEKMERDKSVPLEGERPPRVALMGSCGDGPLLLWAEKEVELWDADKLAPLKVEGKPIHGESQYRYTLRVSPDGKFFTGWHQGISGQSYGLMRVDGPPPGARPPADRSSAAWRVTVTSTPDGHTFNEHWAMPGPGADLTYRYRGGLYDAALKPLAAESFKGSEVFPCEDPRFFVALSGGGTKTTDVTLCSTATRQPLAKLDGLGPTMRSSLNTRWGHFAGEPRVRYLPAPALLIVLPDTNDRVVVRSFDLKEALDKTGKDYLAVISPPPPAVAPGGAFRYPIEVLAREQAVTFKLESGPEGLAVSDKGEVKWAAPAAGGAKTHPVIVTIRTGKGQETTYRFDVRVTAKDRP